MREATATTTVDEPRLGRLRPVTGTVPWDGPDARLAVHDAHCAGHTALHVPERGLLLAGDMASDVEVPLLRHGAPGPEALADHHDGLDRLAALDAVEVAVTGHGQACDGDTWRSRIDADEAVQATLTKAHWRRWARPLPPPGPRTGAVVDAVSRFLGPEPGVVGAYVALAGRSSWPICSETGDEGATRGVQWVDPTEIVAAGRLSKGIGTSLHLVDRLLGREMAMATARQIEYA